MGGGIRCKIFDHIFEEIVSLENLFLAWQKFKKGKTSKIDVQDFNLFLEYNIFNLYYQLINKTYQHSHYTSFYIKDPKLRHIHKARVKDRVLHHAIFKILYSIFDNTFIYDSYSCRINKGTHKAVNRLNQFAGKVSKNNTKTCYILKCDIRRFFDSIDHNILLSLIEKKIKDKDVICLIEKIVKSFLARFNKGIPLGNITSQLFANIYLNELDCHIKHNLRIKYYVRYCDDFIIMNSKKEYLEKLILIIDNFLKQTLKLSLHPGKIIIKRYCQGIDFLGYISFPDHRILRTKTKKRMFRKIDQKLKDLNKDKITEQSFNQAIQSYLGVLGHCNGYILKKEITQIKAAKLTGKKFKPKWSVEF